MHDPYNADYGRISQEFFLKQKRPKVSLYLAVVAKLESSATCMASLKDELFVCLYDGWVHRLSWGGEVLQDLSFNIKSIAFSVDQLHAKCKTAFEGLLMFFSDQINRAVCICVRYCLLPSHWGTLLRAKRRPRRPAHLDLPPIPTPNRLGRMGIGDEGCGLLRRQP